MKNYKALVWGMALLFCGCQWIDKPSEKIETSELNYGYGLLYDVVSQEQDVDKILWIKRVNPELQNLIKQIAELSGKVTDELDSWKKEDPSLILSATGLPELEVKTRDRIAHYKTFDLLGTWGDDFERDLILTQLEALNYMAYMMKSLAASDPQKSRHEFLLENSKEFLALRDTMQSMLVVQFVGAPADTASISDNTAPNTEPGHPMPPHNHHPH